MATKGRSSWVVGLVVGLLAACSGSTPSAAPGTTTSTTAAPSTSASTSTTTDATGLTSQPGSHRVSLDVGGTTRTATVVLPEGATTPAPLVFVFHGHGGSGANIQRKLAIEAAWPEAVVVYPDGLVGHKGKTDP